MNQYDAARAVLLEVMNVLGEYRDEIVIVGGWVPDLMYPNKQHGGSLDVDLAIGPGALGENEYTTVLKRLTDRHYRHATNPTHFYRDVPDVANPVKVDVISGEYVTGEKASNLQVNELSLSSLRGIDLAFEHSEEIKLEGMMPDGSHNVVRARIVKPEAFILIKAFALSERGKTKDAYDIAFILSNYQPSLDALAQQLAPILGSGLGAEAFEILTEKFARLDSAGPTGAAQVAAANGKDYDQAQQAAFQDAQELFTQVHNLRS